MNAIQPPSSATRDLPDVPVPPASSTEVFSDRDIMLIVGLIAFFLSPAVWVINGLRCGTIYPATSVSQYYFSGAHVVFVGGLVTVGVLLLSYRGWGFPVRANRVPWSLQHVFSVASGLCALGVGLIPTALDPQPLRHFGDACSQCNQLVTSLDAVRLTGLPAHWEPGIHTGCAVLLFLWLTYTAMNNFTEPSTDYLERHAPARKALRNRIYRMCAAAMVVGMVLCLLSILGVKVTCFVRACDLQLFIGESLALAAFGVAWLVKSRWLLGYAGQRQGFLRG
ncbi:MAG: hypothetical protein QE265_11770 [Rhodoferax sp.]|nr:hypothetical protein [Rhodoferax sp.]